MTKAKGFWSKQVSGPERAFLLEASSSKFGRGLSVPLIFSAVVFSTGFLFPDQNFFGISVHFLDALSFPSSLLVFAVLRIFKLKKNSVWLNLIFWLVNGLVSAGTPNLILFLLSGKTSPVLGSQFLVGVISYALLTSVISVITAGIRLSRGRFRTLKKHRLVLSEIQRELEAQIDTMRGEIMQSVQAELSKAIRSLSEISNPKELSTRLMLAIDDVIRPLSHRLAGFGVTTDLPKASGRSIKPQGNRPGVSISRLAAPEIYLLLFIVFIVPASQYVDGFTGFTSAMVLLLLEILILSFVERLGKDIFVSRVVGMALLAAFSGAVGLGYLWLVPQNPNSGITVGFVTTSLVVTGLMALVSKRLDDLRELAIVNQKMQAVVSLLRQEAWVTKTRLAKAIHGSVQAKFLAVALRIGASTKLTKVELATARKDIESSIAEVEGSLSGHSIPFASQFQTIANAWDGVAKLHLEADSGTVDTLDSLPVARTCVLEVINEAVANAAKHSKAPAMNIELQENDVNQIVVSVWSAGKLSTQTGRKGYGSQMLDEVTSSWSLTNLKGRVYLRAVIQLSK